MIIYNLPKTDNIYDLNNYTKNISFATYNDYLTSITACESGGCNYIFCVSCQLNYVGKIGGYVNNVSYIFCCSCDSSLRYINSTHGILFGSSKLCSYTTKIAYLTTNAKNINTFICDNKPFSVNLYTCVLCSCGFITDCNCDTNIFYYFGTGTTTMGDATQIIPGAHKDLLCYSYDGLYYTIYNKCPTGRTKACNVLLYCSTNKPSNFGTYMGVTTGPYLTVRYCINYFLYCFENISGNIMIKCN